MGILLTVLFHAGTRGGNLPVVLARIRVFPFACFKEHKLPHGITRQQVNGEWGIIDQFKGNVAVKTGVNESGILNGQADSPDGRTPLNKR